MKTCSCCSGSKTIKRGLWSPDEDQKLKAYVSNHDFKVWSQVPVQAGLDRCGKSCRLRWLNYLRPDIKRGEFSAQEQTLIFELQAAYGNRWSWIAKWIPGRTDNEIKNFWHVHKKNYKKKRQQKSGISSNYRLAAPLKIDTCVSKLEEPKSEEDGPLQLQPESICAAMNNSGCSSSSVDSDPNIGNMNHFMSEFHISEDELHEFLNWVGP